MKKFLTLFLVLLFVSLMAIPSTVQANTTEEVLIVPYRIPVDGEGNRIVTITQDQFVILGAGWGACTKGFAQAWAKTAKIQLYSAGQPMFPSNAPSQYWSDAAPGAGNTSACILPTDFVWFVYWRYPLGTLSPGDHVYHMEYSNDALHIDGGDYDQDGKPDFLTVNFDFDFTIRVIP